MKRLIKLMFLVIIVFLFTLSSFAATENYILIGKNYYDNITDYHAGFLNEKIESKNLLLDPSIENQYNLLKPIDMYIPTEADFNANSEELKSKALAHNPVQGFDYTKIPFTDAASYDKYLKDYTYKFEGNSTNNWHPIYRYWNLWIQRQMPELSLNTQFVNNTYDNFYKNKSFNNGYIDMSGRQDGGDKTFKYQIKNTLSPEDTVNYSFNLSRYWYLTTLKRPDGSVIKENDRTGTQMAFYDEQASGEKAYIYPGFNIPRIPGTRKVLNHGFYIKNNTIYTFPLFDIVDKLYFSYLYIGDGIDQNNQLKFSSNPLSNYNIGYSAKNKIPDLMLNSDKSQNNNFVIPGRYNTTRDDILIAFRGRPFHSSINPQFSITVKDDDGVDIVNSEFRKVLAKTALNFNDAHFNLNLAKMSQAKYLATTEIFNNENSVNFKPLNEVLDGVNNYLNTSYNNPQNINATSYTSRGASSSLGNLTKLSLFFRDSKVDNIYDLSDLGRVEDSSFTYTLSHKITQNGDIHLRNKGELLTQNDTQYKIKFVRPIIKTNSAVTEYNPVNFDSEYGIDSLNITDSGVSKSVNINGGFDNISVDKTRIRVHTRVLGESNWSTAKTFTELKTFLSEDINSGKSFELLYTYAATDALDDIIGKLPNEIKDGQGAYAVPLLRKVNIKEKPKVIIEYKDKDGNIINKTEEITGNVGDNYTTSPKVIDGYKLLVTPNNKDGKYTDNNITVTYIYEKIVVPVITKSKIIVEYKDKDGNIIYKTEEIIGDVGESYTTSPKEISGYKILVVPSNKNGKFTNKNITLTYIYEKIAATQLPKTGSDNSYIVLIALALISISLFLFNTKKKESR